MMLKPDFQQHLNCRDDTKGFTLLHVAIEEYNLTAFNYLIAEPNINLNIYNTDGMSPLLFAIKNEANNFALRLVELGCDVYAKDQHDTTALMYAVKSGDVELSHAILKRGVDVNEQNHAGSALHYSRWFISAEMLDLLIYYGADPRVRNSKNETFFMCLLKIPCPQEEFVELQRLMIEFEDDMNEVNTSGVSTLFLAIKYETPLLEEIIKRGADVNYFYQDLSALYLALETHDRAAFDLIWPRFDYNYVYSYIETPLLCGLFHSLIRSDWLYCFEVLCNFEIIEDAVESYVSQNLPPIVSELIKAFVRRGCTEACLYPCLCTIMSLGVNCCLRDVELAMIHCGCNTDTVNFLLDMDILLEETRCISHLYIALNVTSAVEDIFNAHRFSMDAQKLAEQIKLLPTLFQFFTPTDAFSRRLAMLPDMIEELHLDEFHLNSKDQLVEAYKILTAFVKTNICAIPSLRELSRNATRIAICLRYDIKEYCKYRQALYGILLPKQVLDLLLFREPVNKIHLDLPILDTNYFSLQRSHTEYINF